MPKLSRLNLRDHPHFITRKTYNNEPIFSGPRLARACLIFFEELRKELMFKVLGYSLMPDHIHLILLIPADVGMSQQVKRVKGATARKLNYILGRKGSFWQEGFYDHVIGNREELRDKLKYLHRNALRKNLVKEIGHYEFSSYRDYHWDGYKGYLKVDTDFW